MKKYKVQELISSLDLRTHKLIVRQLNVSRSIHASQWLCLYNYFQDKSNGSLSAKESLQEISHNCFGKKAPKVAEMRRLMSNLYHFIKDQLIKDQLQHHTHTQNFLFVSSLMSMGAYDQSLKVVEQITHSTDFKSSEDHLYQFKLSDLHYDLLSISSRKLDKPLSRSFEQLHYLTLVSYLKEYCKFLSLEKLSISDFDVSIVHSLVETLESVADTSNDDIKRWKWSVEVIKNDDEKSFYHLTQNIVSSYNDDVVFSDLQMQYFICINFAIRQANKGQRKYVEKAFELFKLGLSTRLIYRGDYISRFTYRNIINHGLALQQFKWVEEFMEEYKTSLSPLHRENTYIYNLARYQFYLNEFDEALLHLREAEFNDVSYNLDARRMLLRIYFERQEWITLDYFVDSFKAYLIRKRQSNKVVKNYEPLVKYTKSFLRNQKKPVRLRRLLVKIESERLFVDQNWLAEEIRSFT